MPNRFHKELDNIKKSILSLGALVEERVRMAIRAIQSRDMEIAQTIIRSDYEIDEMEVDIEEECLKVLALHQPVAVDLRFLIAVIKINNDLERIADEAVNIAERVETVAKYRDIPLAIDYSAMAGKTEDMLRLSLDSLVNLDIDLAFQVFTMDDEVDRLHVDSYRRTKDAIRQSPDSVAGLINYYLISRHLERIGDHATNIAEEVVYLIEGDIVRHGGYETAAQKSYEK
jgi:phosphate transport system protein